MGFGIIADARQHILDLSRSVHIVGPVSPLLFASSSPFFASSFSHASLFHPSPNLFFHLVSTLAYLPNARYSQTILVPILSKTRTSWFSGTPARSISSDLLLFLLNRLTA